MTIGEACVLGLVQGLTEFLPISSKGHLALVHRFLTPLPPDQQVAIDVALHVGTLIAVFAYFRKELLGMTMALLAPKESGWRFRWIWLLGLASIPAVTIGVTLKDRIIDTFDSMPVLGLGFLVTGTMLYFAMAVRGADRDEETLGLGAAMTIGCFQALALLPGISRSGSTISGGIFARVRPDVAARFSFLLGIPAILGAVVLQVPSMAGLGPEARVPLLTGVAVAGVSGLAAIWTVLRLVETGRLYWFSYYTWVLGTAVLVGTAFFGL
jgi:undecaprenyl-diphosphatase